MLLDSINRGLGHGWIRRDNSWPFYSSPFVVVKYGITTLDDSFRELEKSVPNYRMVEK
jgi:hypothetical protein